METLHHLLYGCPHSKTFWVEFELYWLSIPKERICLSKKDIIVGIITRSCPLLNYIRIIFAKPYLWDCRSNQAIPNIKAFNFKVQIKYETELYIARNGKNLEFLREKWAADFSIFLFSVKKKRISISAFQSQLSFFFFFSVSSEYPLKQL